MACAEGRPSGSAMESRQNRLNPLLWFCHLLNGANPQLFFFIALGNAFKILQ